VAQVSSDMARGKIGAGERLAYLTLLFVTGDVEPGEPTLYSTAYDIVAMVDADDLGSLPHRMVEGAASEPSMDRLRTSAERLHATNGRATFVKPVETRRLGSGGRSGAFDISTEHGDGWHLVLELSGEGEIDRVLLEPAVTRSAPLSLPVRGEWKVSAAGPLPATNPHVSFPDQRRAADLVVVDASGSTHRGDGSRNEDYFAYGREIVAMADGVARVAVDGVLEKVPGERQTIFVSGNMVLLEHSDGLYTKYCHLIPGSIRVAPGDVVRRGQVLGLCGNSGHSSKPHLHVHGQDRSLEEGAWGVELVFDEVSRVHDGERIRVPDYEFRKGDVIVSSG
jgi:hypothetical protein